MKIAVSIAVSLATSLLLACGAGPESSADESVTSPPAASDSATEVSSDSSVSPMACTTLWRPRYSTYWSSFPIEADGQVGGCETNDDCTTTCWGDTDGPYVIHQSYFYCTACY